MTGRSPVVAECPVAVVVVEGDDASNFLQGQLSQDVAGLDVGAGAPSLLLEPDGKLVALLGVLRLEPQCFELWVHPGQRAEVETRLKRFLLRTKATIVVEDGVVELGVDQPPVDHELRVEAAGRSWSLRRLDQPAAERVTGRAAFEHARCHAGIPWPLTEATAGIIPGSLGADVIDAAVSFTKGCYTGQELVARVDARGGNVPFLLRRLRLGGPVVVGASVHRGDAQPLGQLSTVSVLDGEVLGLALLHRNVEIGTVLVAEDASGVPVPVEVLGAP